MGYDIAFERDNHSPSPRHKACGEAVRFTDHQLRALMALAMQTARDAIAMTDQRSVALECALSSLDIALKFEADYWQQTAKST